MTNGDGISMSGGLAVQAKYDKYDWQYCFRKDSSKGNL